MAFKSSDRVRETSTTTGTGTLDLAGAVTQFETFVDGVGTGSTVHYAIVHRTLNEWEVGEGVVTDASPDTLSRDTVFASTNADALVSFSAGTKDVFITHPAKRVEAALHDDVAGEIAAVAAKATPVAGDFLLIEDSAAANAKKSITAGTLKIAGDVTGTLAASTVGDLTIASEAQGDILYFNGANWVRLAPGTAGQRLRTNGAAANPAWEDTAGEFLFIFASGALTVAEALGRIRVPFDITVTAWRGHSGTGSTGAGDKFALTRSGTADDPLVFGTTVIADTAAAMADGAQRGSTTTIASANVDAGSWLKLNCTGVAATPGQDHQAVIEWKRR